MDVRCLSNEAFIQRCKQKHGDRYCYSQTVYETCRTPVTIICRVHGAFQQMPLNHTSKGNGCKQCTTTASRKTTQLFIEEAKLIHGDEYDYSKTEYVRARSKVIILCKRHGEFLQSPICHTKHGHGCPSCGKTKQNISQEYFLERCCAVHGGQYDFSQSKSRAHLDITTVRCPKHGPFEIRTNYLLNGNGCPKCSLGGVSKASIVWLDTAAEVEGLAISHKLNSGSEFRIPTTRYHADGYCQETNTVYEFLGDYYHGNPRVYPPATYNKKLKRTMGQLHDETCRKMRRVRGLGYHVDYIWEDEWKCVEILAEMQGVATRLEAP